MAKVKTKFVCLECGYESVKWLGKCPDCSGYSTFTEERIFEEKNASKKILDFDVKKPVCLDHIEIVEADRVKTGMEELDRVLGDGFVKGSLVLIGGEPGIGKSTLLLQVSELVAKKEVDVLYITGEESLSQIKMRADRLGVLSKQIHILPETNIEIIIETIKKDHPQFLIVDSIQTIYTDEITSVPGSVSQVREITNMFMNISKNMGITTVIIGHVTKEGNIAGPKILEHMVDTVLYFEGERLNTNRIIRTVKNRFGSTNEIGVFEMGAKGLIEIAEPSKLLIESKKEASGSVIGCALEGTRPLLLEIQALVTKTNLPMPRRTAIGIDYNRLSLLVAIIEKHLNVYLGAYDVYVNVVGGFKVNDTSTDLAVVTAVLSSYYDQILPNDVAFVGEVGLLGEIRSIINFEARQKELKKMGFKYCFTANTDTVISGFDVKLIQNVRDLRKTIKG